MIIKRRLSEDVAVKCLQIRSCRLMQTEENQTRLAYEIAVEHTRRTVYFDAEQPWGMYFSENLADGLLLQLIQYAIMGKMDIESFVPVSRSLLYRLEKQVIPQLVLCTEDSYRPHITCPISTEVFAPEGVATGLSLGVDSFTTFFEYTRDCPPEADKITHVTFFDACHHYLANDPHKVFEEQLAQTRQFCREYHLPLVVIRSNIHTVLQEMFPWEFFQSEPLEPVSTYRNCGFVLLMPKLFKTYYYSASYNLDSFACDLYGDVTRYEKWLLPLISTDTTRFWSTNCAMSRIQKTEYIAQFPETYRYLTVCSFEGKNCGHCGKCFRTEFTLEKMGLLDCFSSVFDVERFRQQTDHFRGELMAEQESPLFDEVIQLYKKEITFKNRLVGKVLHIRRYNPKIRKIVDWIFRKVPHLRSIYKQ